MSQEFESAEEQELTALHESASSLIPQCRFAGAYQLFGELRRRARAESQVIHYIWATFHQMDLAQYLLNFQQMRERAVELIALLQHEERARQIQSDFPQSQYDYLRWSMSSCAYENLAEATGQLGGYNSEGMHACIADGIQICRRTGKTSCVSCFREYACDVYTAADDVEIAAHQCRAVRDQAGNWSDRGDRRWLAVMRLSWLDALHGRYSAAIEGSAHAVVLAQEPEVAVPLEAQLRTALLRDTVSLASGRTMANDDTGAADLFPAGGECPLLEHQRDLNRALEAASEEDWEGAAELLHRWDQQLLRSGSLHLWFETRLRLTAVRILAGEQKQAMRLARSLERRARKAHDYLTLRRLQILLDSDEPSPIALVVPGNSVAGHVAAGQLSEARSQDGSSKPVIQDNGAGCELDATEAGGSSAEGSGRTEAVAAEVDGPFTPLTAEIEKLHQRVATFTELPSADEYYSLRAELMQYSRSCVTHTEDACALLELMVALCGSGEDGEQIWRWGNALIAGRRESAAALSALAILGDSLRASGDEEMLERITEERTEQLHRQAMDLSPESGKVFLRAGQHFLASDQAGEAERCLARAFRLERRNGVVARYLAELYRSTDRPRDALYVLDLCLRQGCEDAQVAFDAGMLAYQLEQYDEARTCLMRYEQLEGPGAWVHYYLALCSYEQGDYSGALVHVERDRELRGEDGWHLSVVEVISKARIEKSDELLAVIEVLATTPLHEIGFLSTVGLTDLLQRLGSVLEDQYPQSELLKRVERRLLRAGLMPDTWFHYQRENSGLQPQDDLHLYRCLIYQPLSESWLLDPDRQTEQEDWTGYYTEWGILAESEEVAAEVALEYQRMCHDEPAEVREVIDGGDIFREIPGVVWQSSRYMAGADDPASGEGFAGNIDDEDDDDESESQW